MKKQNSKRPIIRMSYGKISKSVRVNSVVDSKTGNIIQNTKTIVTLPCIFKSNRFVKEIEDFGFKTFPEGMKNILQEHGFRYDHILNGWVTYVTGVATHTCIMDRTGEIIEQDDVYSDRWGFNVAMTKAKCKAQYKASSLMYDFSGLFNVIGNLFTNTAEHYGNALENEVNALENATRTGYCDGKERK